LPGNKADIDDLLTLRAAVCEAGELALSYLRKGNLKTWDKTKGHPVTEADIAVNNLIREQLMRARPDYGWLSEETDLDSQTRTGRRVWVVDPIDGTRAYMRGQPYWCIGAGVLEQGRARVGVVHAPQLGETYEARLGAGAYLNGRRIQVSGHAAIEDCRMIAAPSLFTHAQWPEMQFANPRPNATLLRICRVASGAWDATLALSRKSDWDLAPATCIIAEAGGLATTHLGEPYVFNRDEPAQRSLLAAGKALHSLLSARVKGVRLPDPNWTVRPNERTRN